MQNSDQEIVKTSIIINKELWREFKNYAKLNNSDANKEMRKMISNYVKKYRTKNKQIKE